MSEWPNVALAVLASAKGLVGGPFGSSLVGSDYVSDGVPVIRGTNMSGPWVGGDFVYVSEEKFQKDLARNTATPGDLVFTQRGTLGQVALVPYQPYETYVISQSQMRLRPDVRKTTGRFLYYACSASSFLRQIRDRAITTGVPHINLGILGGLTVPHPALPEQDAIAEVLGALDDKITANAALIATADRLSRLRFESLLVDADLRPLSSIARFINGKAFTKGATGSGRVVIRIAELNSGLGGSTVYNDIEVADDHLARPGDLLFAWSGSLTVHRWFRPEGIVNQHIFKVIPSGVPIWVVKGALDRKLLEFRAIAADKATTMGHIQRRHLDELVEVPSSNIIEANNEAMGALWPRALSAEQESLCLEGLRDVLLPQLMSGKIRVRDAERLVEKVV